MRPISAALLSSIRGALARAKTRVEGADSRGCCQRREGEERRGQDGPGMDLLTRLWWMTMTGSLAGGPVGGFASSGPAVGLANKLQYNSACRNRLLAGSIQHPNAPVALNIVAWTYSEPILQPPHIAPLHQLMGAAARCRQPLWKRLTDSLPHPHVGRPSWSVRANVTPEIRDVLWIPLEFGSAMEHQPGFLRILVQAKLRKTEGACTSLEHREATDHDSDPR